MSKKAGRSVIIIFVSTGLFFQGCGQSQAGKSDQTPVDADKISAPGPAKVESAKPSSSPSQFKPFNVYTDANAPDNHYTPSGWMGDYGDIKMNEQFLTNPHGGSTSIQIGYSAKGAQGARWAGVYWQNPSNNWGTRPGGYDLTGAKKLTFWARGEKGGERIEEFKIGGITGEYADSDVAGIGPVVLTLEWQPFTIDLDGKDLSSISGGFCWVANADGNPTGFTIYLDDIRYE